MPARYAANTEVPVDRTRAEIENTLERYGARSFAYGWEGNQAVVMFEVENRRIRFLLQMPDLMEDEFQLTPSRKWARSEKEARAAWDQARKQRWRALALVIKAKLEAVSAGITTVEEEFLAHIVLPDGSTVGQQVRPRIEAAYAGGQMLPMLPAVTGEAR